MPLMCDWALYLMKNATAVSLWQDASSRMESGEISESSGIISQWFTFRLKLNTNACVMHNLGQLMLACDRIQNERLEGDISNIGFLKEPDKKIVTGSPSPFLPLSCLSQITSGPIHDDAPREKTSSAICIIHFMAHLFVNQWKKESSVVVARTYVSRKVIMLKHKRMRMIIKWLNNSTLR